MTPAACSATSSGATALERPCAPLGRRHAAGDRGFGEIAVIQDEGDVVTPPNTFDLQLTGLRFVPRAGGGYDIAGSTRVSYGARRCGHAGRR